MSARLNRTVVLYGRRASSCHRPSSTSAATSPAPGRPPPGALRAEGAPASGAVGACRLRIAGILCCEAADGGPIEAVAALREEPQKAVVQQAAERHGHAQTLGRLEREPDVLESERRGESGRLKPAFGAQATVGLVSGRREDCRSEQINVGPPIDTRLADERDGLAQCLDGGGEQEVSAELD